MISDFVRLIKSIIPDKIFYTWNEKWDTTVLEYIGLACGLCLSVETFGRTFVLHRAFKPRVPRFQQYKSIRSLKITEILNSLI
jgi:hypothetical protein